MKRNPQVKLTKRVVGLIDPSCTARKALDQRGFTVLEEGIGMELVDAFVVLKSGDCAEELLSKLLPGGVLVADRSFDVCEADFVAPAFIEGTSCISRVKLAARAHTSSCPWLSSSFSAVAEQERLLEATIALSAFEVRTSCMTDTTVVAAAAKLREYGYVVIKKLLNPEECQKWGRAVLESVHLAAKVLLEKEKVDILNPQMSANEPQTYKEVRR
eukprot:scaffold91_cov127-Cylindrotheca_fusiformis.AAC.40